LLYRLLQDYPMDRLEIVEAGLHASLPERRLKDIRYHFLSLPFTRLQKTRFSHWYTAVNLRLAARRARKLGTLIEKFRPQAILTVTHGISWITAAEIARRKGLPLHLICHDEWVDSFPVLSSMKNWMERIFRTHYRAANSRLCVSPYMVESNKRRYGVSGTVLYPSRAADAAASTVPPERLQQPKHPLVCAFAGSVHTTDYRRALRLLAECLKPINGKLLIFGPTNPEQENGSELRHSNIHWQGLVDAKKLAFRLREEVDVLFVPMSFAVHDRGNMETSFPSKLADYTAVGLPLLIYGPEYCSAVRWARENSGVAEVVENADADQMMQAVRRLADNPQYLQDLGRQAIEAGERFFSSRKAREVFQNALLGLAA
jgi:glycosyltransferase involved in cell wall biosynthesis